LAGGFPVVSCLAATNFAEWYRKSDAIAMNPAYFFAKKDIFINELHVFDGNNF